MTKFEGRVALVTGAARGQGRSHAVRFASEGADIIALDICDEIPSIPYPLATFEDLAETAAQVEALGRRVFTATADVRDRVKLTEVVRQAATELGRAATIVIANAGVAPMSRNPVDEEWDAVIGVNLTGVYNTVQATAPAMIEAGQGGSIILIGSTASLAGVGGNTPGGLGYTASKHGVVGLMRAYANYLAADNIRVNALLPTGVYTPMILNDVVQDYIRSDPQMSGTNALPVSALQPYDVSNAAAWLASDEAKYLTGVALPVDAGYLNKR